jgi:hypothetical protein
MALLREPTKFITKGIIRSIMPLVNRPDRYTLSVNVPEPLTRCRVKISIETGRPKVAVNGEVDYLPSLTRQVPQIHIFIEYPLGSRDLEELVGLVKYVVRHELEHVDQFLRGQIDVSKCVDPTFRPSIQKVLDHLLAPHEIQAYIAGFRTNARATKKPLTEVMEDWWNRRWSWRFPSWGMTEQEPMLQEIVFSTYTSHYKRRYGRTRELP